METRQTVNWDERYGQEEYIFGTEPNEFLVSVIDKIPPNSRVLSLCEGEGRNAAFLAQKGFQVTAVDGSKVGLEKAKKLAASKQVSFEMIVADLEDYQIEKDGWDAILLTFGHFPAELRKKVLASVVKGLRKNAVFILEAFSPAQLQYETGGPKDVSKLYDLPVVKNELEGLDFEIARETTRIVCEGDAHNGKSAVVQIFARKKRTS